MKIKIIASILGYLFFSAGFLQAEPAPDKKIEKTGISIALDGGVALFGGLGIHANWYYKNIFFGTGFYRFPSNPEFGGYDPKFNLFVDYIFAAQAGWYFWPGNKKGFYLAMIYHIKRQTVTEVSSGNSVRLYSQLIGPELGYEWNFWGPVYIAPRIGALYYIQRPQGYAGAPVSVGNSSYDNPNHKIWDLYYTLSIGVNLDFQTEKNYKRVNK